MEADKLVVENNQFYSDALRFPMGPDYPEFTVPMMREYLELIDSNGGWPFGKAYAVEQMKLRYEQHDTGWVPVFEEPS